MPRTTIAASVAPVMPARAKAEVHSWLWQARARSYPGVRSPLPPAPTPSATAAQCGDIVRTAQTYVGSPMHALRPIREDIEHVRAATQPSANLPRLSEPAVSKRFSLTCIRQTIASSAREGAGYAVQQRDSAPAELPENEGATSQQRVSLLFGDGPSVGLQDVESQGDLSRCEALLAVAPSVNSTVVECSRVITQCTVASNSSPNGDSKPSTSSATRSNRFLVSSSPSMRSCASSTAPGTNSSNYPFRVRPLRRDRLGQTRRPAVGIHALKRGCILL
jgi:hypothetical protein